MLNSLLNRLRALIEQELVCLEEIEALPDIEWIDRVDNVPEFRAKMKLLQAGISVEIACLDQILANESRCPRPEL